MSRAGKTFVPLKDLTAMKTNRKVLKLAKDANNSESAVSEKKETCTKLVQESTSAGGKKFQDDLNENVRDLQFDYAMVYQCENQQEVYLFLSAFTHTALIVKGKING